MPAIIFLCAGWNVLSHTNRNSDNVTTNHNQHRGQPLLGLASPRLAPFDAKPRPSDQTSRATPRDSGSWKFRPIGRSAVATQAFGRPVVPVAP